MHLKHETKLLRHLGSIILPMIFACVLLLMAFVRQGWGHALQVR
ncbi:MAG: hypothetical protein U5K79_05245 [Cyclobacteriaceae bacterium]|nr:hypothetical protein [Cyclobacteriaceae bacterium]